jgi:hypothetical protein
MAWLIYDESPGEVCGVLCVMGHMDGWDRAGCTRSTGHLGSHLHLHTLQGKRKTCHWMDRVDR